MVRPRITGSLTTLGLVSVEPYVTPVAGTGGSGSGAGSAGAASTTSGEPPRSSIAQFLRDLVDVIDEMTTAPQEEGLEAGVGDHLAAAWQELRGAAVDAAGSIGAARVSDEMLAAAGLDGTQLEAKLAAFSRARSDRAARRGPGSTFDTLRSSARLVRRIGVKVLGSLVSVLGEDPRIKAVLEAVKELLELLDQAAEEAEVRQHHAGPADAGYLQMLGYGGIAQ